MSKRVIVSPNMTGGQIEMDMVLAKNQSFHPFFGNLLCCIIIITTVITTEVEEDEVE
jgi:hypothetical protein